MVPAHTLFQPRYFNYRTTRFLTEEGFYKFHNWFDDRAWYPLGRIIGGTIYPGEDEIGLKLNKDVKYSSAVNRVAMRQYGVGFIGGEGSCSTATHGHFPLIRVGFNALLCGHYNGHFSQLDTDAP